MNDMRIPYITIDAANFDVPQERKRIIAGSPALLESLERANECGKIARGERASPTPAESLAQAQAQIDELGLAK